MKLVLFGLCWIFTCPMANIVLLRYVADKEDPYLSHPFLSVAICSSPQFLYAVILLIKQRLRTRTMQYIPNLPLRTSQFISVGMLHSSYLLLTSAAVFNLSLNLVLLIVSSQVDYMFTYILAPLILKRKYSMSYLFAATVALISISLFSVFSISDEGKLAFSIPTSNEVWIGILFLALSRICYVLRGFFSKLFIIQYAAQYKKKQLSACKNHDTKIVGQNDFNEEEVKYINKHLYYSQQQQTSHALANRNVLENIRLKLIDKIFDNSIYDTTFFGATCSETIQLYTCTTGIFAAPIALWISFFTGECEKLSAILSLNHDLLFALTIISVATLIYPYLLHQVIFKSFPGEFTLLVAAKTIVVLIFTEVYFSDVKTSAQISILHVIGILAILACILWTYAIPTAMTSLQETKRRVDMASKYFSRTMPEYIFYQNYFLQVANLVGKEDVNQMLISTLSSDENRVSALGVSPGSTIWRVLDPDFHFDPACYLPYNDNDLWDGFRRKKKSQIETMVDTALPPDEEKGSNEVNIHNSLADISISPVSHGNDISEEDRISEERESTSTIKNESNSTKPTKNELTDQTEPTINPINGSMDNSEKFSNLVFDSQDAYRKINAENRDIKNSTTDSQKIKIDTEICANGNKNEEIVTEEQHSQNEESSTQSFKKSHSSTIEHRYIVNEDEDDD